MSGPLARAALWTDLPCNGGTYVCEIPLSSCDETERIENHVLANRLECSVPATWEDADQIIARRVIQLSDTLGSVPVEYRIISVVDGFPAPTITIRGQGVVFDLAEGGTLVTKTASPAIKLTWVPSPDTLVNLQAEVLPFAPTYFSAGANGVLTVLAPSYDADSVLSATVKQLVLLQQGGDGTYEVSARNRGGTTGYYVDIAQTNLNTVTPEFRPAKNISTYARTKSTDQQVTRCYPRGVGGPGVGDAQFVVTAVVLNTSITVAGIDDSGNFFPVIEANALNGLYWLHEDGVSHLITASTTAGVLSMASTTGIAVGEWGRPALNSGGDYLTYVDYPSKQATYGVKVGTLPVEIPGHTNWMKNGDLATYDWPGADPNGWTTALNRFTKTTTTGLFVTGGASAYTGAAANVVSLLQDRSVYCPAGSTVTYFWRVYFTRITGVVTSDHTDIGNPNTGTNDQWNYDPGTSVVSSLQVTTGQWYEFTKSYSVTAAGVKTLHFGFWRDGTVVGGGGLYYVDCAQVTVIPQGVDPAQGFVRSSGGGLLWAAAQGKLLANGDPPATYNLGIVDLFRYDGTTWPYEELLIGANATIKEDITLAGTNAAGLRIMEVQRNWLNPLDTRLTVSTLPLQLTGVLAA